MERKLATIAKIISLFPIPEADAIEVARIRGWQVVVKKGEFQEGDFCVYCEVDSVMPERPEFEFLRERKFRIRTMKLKGQVSQGIAFPLVVLGGKGPDYGSGELSEGDDVTEWLGVKLYEPPQSGGGNGQPKGNFPFFIPKTDEERIQNIADILVARCAWWTTNWVTTEKVDGTSVTVYRKDGILGVCSRNLELKLDEDSPGRTVQFTREWVLDRLADSWLDQWPNVAIQGELIGPGIQGNKYKLGHLEWRVFSVFDIDAQRYVPSWKWGTLTWGNWVRPVPFLLDCYKNLPSCGPALLCDTLVEQAKGPSMLGTSGTQREGIVIRHEDPENWCSFKVINPDFLLKWKE